MKNISLRNKKVSDYLISNGKEPGKTFAKYSSHFHLYANF